jgi:hypothetical protein
MLIPLTLVGKSMSLISGAYRKMLMPKAASETRVLPEKALLSCRV